MCFQITCVGGSGGNNDDSGWEDSEKRSSSRNCTWKYYKYLLEIVTAENLSSQPSRNRIHASI